MRMYGSLQLYESFLPPQEWAIIENLVNESKDYYNFVMNLIEYCRLNDVSDHILMILFKSVKNIAKTGILGSINQKYSESKITHAWQLWFQTVWDGSLAHETREFIENLINQDFEEWMKNEMKIMLHLTYNDPQEDIQKFTELHESCKGAPEFKYYEIYSQYLIATGLTGLEEYDRALEILIEVVTSAKQYDLILELPYFLNSLGFCIPTSERIEIYQELIDLTEELNYDWLNIIGLNNLGFVHITRGEYARAMELLERAYSKAKATGLPSYYPALNLAEIHEHFGDATSALKYAQEGFEIAEKSDPTNPYAYLVLARALIMAGQMDKAFEYLESGGELAHKSGKKKQQSDYYYARGVFEVHNNHLDNARRLFLRSYSMAQELHDIENIARTILFLIEINMTEFVNKSDDTHMSDTYSYLDLLSQISQEQDLIGLQVQVESLRAQIANILNRKKEATALLKKALDICSKYGLDQLRTKLTEQLEEIKKVSSSQSLLKRFHSFIGQISIMGVRARRTKFKVLGCIIIMRNAGIEVFSKYLDERLISDPSLVAGLITAVSNFARELQSGSRGNLQSIVHEDIAVLLEHQKNVTCALLCDKDCSEAKMLERRFLAKFIEHYGDKLEKFDDGYVEFIDASDLLMETINQLQG